MTAATTAPQATACILCSRNCGLKVTVEDGRLTSVRGDEAHPMTRGYLCQKAARLDHYQHHAERLRHPLRRKPDGTFERVSWDEALGDIAARLAAIKAAHGGDAFAMVGGGGQGNHLGGVYGHQLLGAMGSRFAYSALAQEKTGDFWVNGRLFGRQTCHTTEDVEHADVVLFIGCNPYQSHGIPNARDTLKHLARTPGRMMVVIDPRRTETAKQAHVHLQLRPGTDAFLLSAMLAIIVREGLHDADFLAAHCTGADEVLAALRAVPVEDWLRRADVPLADVQRVARAFATAERACVRIDLGLQHTLHCTLNGWLEKLLYLLTGHFGKRGGNNLHTSMMPLIGHTDERPGSSPGGKALKRTAFHGMHPIAGLYPPNLLPDEILKAGDKRLRAVFVDSANPALSYADTQSQRQAFAALELLVVVDVAMTETARLAHYVLPAASQFEKAEATAFNLEFPDNFFHLRHPLTAPLDEALPEPEIYTRLLERMGVLPTTFGMLSAVARHEPSATGHAMYLAALAATLARRPGLVRYGASIVYRTLGPTMPKGLEAAAVMLPLAVRYASEYREAVRRAGHRGGRLTLGANLFRAILEGRSGVVTSRHLESDVWSLVKTPDRRIHLAVPEMLAELGALADEAGPPVHRPFVLMAGERRAYNANQIFRDPAWRKVDRDGALRLHPEDAATLGLADGARARCASDRAEIEVSVQLDDSVRRGVVSLPHGYGQVYAEEETGPAVNVLTSTDWCDPITKTPRHKYVPVSIESA